MSSDWARPGSQAGTDGEPELRARLLGRLGWAGLVGTQQEVTMRHHGTTTMRHYLGHTTLT